MGSLRPLFVIIRIDRFESTQNQTHQEDVLNHRLAFGPDDEVFSIRRRFMVRRASHQLKPHDWRRPKVAELSQYIRTV